VNPTSQARFNYWTLVVEGAFFGGALTFVNASTLLPAIVQSLGGAVWLVSLMPVIMLVGFRLPPIFTAHRIERLHAYKPFLIWTGIIQRIPFGIAGIALLWCDKAPLAALIIVASVPLISGIFGGVGVTAWQQLLTKCIPSNRRHSLFAIRFAINCGIGIFAGETIRRVLTHWPGTTGFAILHFCAFALLLGSITAFSLVREPHEDRAAPASAVSLTSHLRSIPGLLKDDHQFLRLLVVRYFISGTYIVTPFLAIHCLAILSKPDSYLGQLVVVQMCGAIAGNLAAAWLGDRFGSKATLALGIATFAGMSAWAMTARSKFAWEAIFFLFGFGFYACEVGMNAVGLEMGPREKRATFLSVASLSNLAGMLSAAGISTLVWQFQHSFSLLAALTISAMAIAAYHTLWLNEPRH
jgi:MFS family permease